MYFPALVGTCQVLVHQLVNALQGVIYSQIHLDDASVKIFAATDHRNLVHRRLFVKFPSRSKTLIAFGKEKSKGDLVFLINKGTV
jgi:hypothetical protein